MNQFKMISRRGTLAFAMLFALVSLHPLALTGFAQKGQTPQTRTAQEESERQTKADYQLANPIRPLTKVEGAANGPVSTNAVGNTTYNITFDAGDAIGGLPAGSILSNQYTAITGATFTANAFSGPGGPTGPWATNTDRTVVDSAGTDAGGLGTPLLVSGNILRSFTGWTLENGDPSLRVSFAIPVSTFSATFCGIGALPSNASTSLRAFDGANNQIATATVSVITGQETLTVSSATPIASVVILPGDFDDWVGVDNFSFRTVNAVTPVNVNSSISYTQTGAALTGTTCPLGSNYSNEYNLNANIVNIGTTTLNNVFFQVIELREANGTPPLVPFRLKTADDFVSNCSGGGLVGSRQAIPSPILASQLIPVTFRIAMPTVRRFRFFVSVFADPNVVGRTGNTRKIGVMGFEVTGFDAAGNPQVSGTFTPEKGLSNTLKLSGVTATASVK